MPSSQNNLPQRMYRNERPKKDDFKQDEMLYRRFPNGQFEDGRILPSSINLPLPGCSANRSSLSEPEDVLLPSYLNWGIAVFIVGDIPPSLTCSCGKRICDFRIEHMPLEENYAHTEIQSFKNKSFDKPREPGSIIGKKFRQIISDKAAIIRYPKDAFE